MALKLILIVCQMSAMPNKAPKCLAAVLTTWMQACCLRRTRMCKCSVKRELLTAMDVLRRPPKDTSVRVFDPARVNQFVVKRLQTNLTTGKLALFACYCCNVTNSVQGVVERLNGVVVEKK